MWVKMMWLMIWADLKKVYTLSLIDNRPDGELIGDHWISVDKEFLPVFEMSWECVLSDRNTCRESFLKCKSHIYFIIMYVLVVLKIII